LNLLGHGKSDCLGYVHSIEEMAKVVKFVLEVLEVKLVSLIGHSMGGYVALALAEADQSVVKGLCLMNSSAQEDSIERKKLRVRAVKMAQTNYEALVSMSVSNLFTKDTRTQFLTAKNNSRKIALETKVQGYIACTEGMRQRVNREHVLIEGRFKKLIIAGKKDPVLPYDSIVKEAERTGTNIVSFSNGHMSHIENLLELIKILKEFVN